MKTPVHLKSSGQICLACENFMSEAVNYLSEKQTQDKVMEFLHDACSKSFSFEEKVIISEHILFILTTRCVCIEN